MTGAHEFPHTRGCPVEREWDERERFRNAERARNAAVREVSIWLRSGASPRTCLMMLRSRELAASAIVGRS